MQEFEEIEEIKAGGDYRGTPIQGLGARLWQQD